MNFRSNRIFSGISEATEDSISGHLPVALSPEQITRSELPSDSELRNESVSESVPPENSLATIEENSGAKLLLLRVYLTDLTVTHGAFAKDFHTQTLGDTTQPCNLEVQSSHLLPEASDRAFVASGVPCTYQQAFGKPELQEHPG